MMLLPWLESCSWGALVPGVRVTGGNTMPSSFLAGLLITLADKVGLILKNARATSLVNQIGGGMMMGVGVFIFAKA